MSADVELFGTAGCPYTSEMREHLMWNGTAFEEHDVEADPAALARMLELTRGRRMVPVLVEQGRVAEVGWRGRGCLVEAARGG